MTSQVSISAVRARRNFASLVEMIKPRPWSPSRPRAASAVRLALAALSSAFLVLLLPAMAHAGQVGVTVQIQGSGSVNVVEGSLEDGASGRCNWFNNQNDRVTNSCGRFRSGAVFEAWVWLRPTPSSHPTGHWRFEGWTGCDETRFRDGTTECGVHSGAFNAVERSPKAHFADDFPPTVSPVHGHVFARG